MNTVQINIKLLKPDCVLPTKATPDDAGFDCVANWINETDSYIEYGLGFAIEIPSGYAGLLFPRSSVTKKDLVLGNSVGLIDPGYRNEVCARFKKLGDSIYKVGDRVCQLVIIKNLNIELLPTSDLSLPTDRHGGFGSTGS